MVQADAKADAKEVLETINADGVFLLKNSYLDFDEVEKLLEAAWGKEREEKNQEEKEKPKQRSSRSRSRSRDRSRGRRREREGRDKEKDRVEEEKLQREMEEEMKKRVKNARADRTIMISGLNSKHGERDIFEFFFSKAGGVNDVQIIRDARSGKPRGVGYVEFETQEECMKAIALSGHECKGVKLTIQPAQAEKPRPPRT
eukprot:gnl/TRDRNA2_/TRDRNA2_180262_c0_seq1.p1 gnl/TRDRNA2_/TRDRNA2_180262_c0~~gnl/TRDRNA2_/TRDRNA2_180262_c0_seq1.p1  ORF type:complete len:201 (-),score=56.87 gnl/TRDRNA2_/TRDRNA2_180262_c0_seq1:108-710(-)